MKAHERTFGVLAALAVVLVLAVVSACGGDDGLKVTGLSRSTGVSGDTLTIYGSGFMEGGSGTRGVKVYFGNHSSKNVFVRNDREIKAEIPGGNELGKPVDLKLIFEPGGEFTRPRAFTYTEQNRTDVGDLVKDEKAKPEQK